MQIVDCGENGVILSVSYDQTAKSAAAVQRIYRQLQLHPHPSVNSVRPGLDCILIEFHGKEFEEWLQQNLSALETEVDDQQQSHKLSVEVPICYDFGQDIPAISAATGLTREEIIRIHSGTTYDVWMMGFMPGFPYLGELPQALQIRRKDTPNVSISAGSVAIAEEYVGIYPFQSPGGWHVIGRIPWKIFDAQENPPCRFQYGMQVKFVSIPADEFERMSQ